MPARPQLPATEQDAPERFTSRVDLDVKKNEVWWGGSVADGTAMPYGQAPFARDLASSDQYDSAD
ncbi:MAG: hypothetical protein FWF28_10185, partial [Micrococcales bacterium]|nr:hypothetical protein [Micrococcales bacterium]